MGVESATCLSPQGELSRVPPATEYRKGARRAPAPEQTALRRMPSAFSANANTITNVKAQATAHPTVAAKGTIGG